jgi:hypothetical protein
MAADREKAGKNAFAGGAESEVADAIGRQLKSTYGKLLSEPIPEKFLDLLEKLEAEDAPPEFSGKEKG